MYGPNLESVRMTSGGLINALSASGSMLAFAANPHRRGFFAQNDSNAPWYIRFGGDASSTAYTIKLPSASLYELPRPLYTGSLYVYTPSGTVGYLAVTELDF